jgi:septal ring factor EnvC (AmiA/AmiB activator)
MKKIYPLRSFQMMHGIGVSAVVAIFITGCASIPAPTEQMAVSKVAVSNATSAGGNEFAPQPLKSAMGKMDAAERAMAEKDYLRARQLAEQAQVDAQLATVTARSDKAQKAARELQEDNRVLQQEIERKVHHANLSIFPHDPDRCRDCFRL